MDTPTGPGMNALPPEEEVHSPRDWSALLFHGLGIAIALMPVLTVAGLVVGVLAARTPAAWAGHALPAIAWLLGGLGATTLCVTTYALLRLQRRVVERTELVDQHLAALAERAFTQAGGQPAKSAENTDLLEVRRLLADMREIMLLPEEQRSARFRTLMQMELRRRLTLVGQYIDSREFHRAREELASLADRFGVSDDLRRAEDRLTVAMRAALQEDVETTTRKVADLMGMSRWEQAEQYARELTQKYPEASDARKLLVRVQEERVLFDRRHRQRMHDEIQQFVTQRRWREAAGAAEMFIQTFPTGVDTDALRQQLEALKANAEIEIRQHLERHIKDHIVRKNYWDALDLARRIISEYPFSPQANALRTQLPRLEELARQQGARG